MHLFKIYVNMSLIQKCCYLVTQSIILQWGLIRFYILINVRCNIFEHVNKRRTMYKILTPFNKRNQIITVNQTLLIRFTRTLYSHFLIFGNYNQIEKSPIKLQLREFFDCN